MPKFLNTEGLSTWIPRIIEETQRELVIITPYMQLSDKIYKLLLDAEMRGVETIIIYRENKLSDKEKEKLKSIDNLNLMHHPNIHAKCYYSENYLLIASMNLYEYSEINNREMGVLLNRKVIEDEEEDDFGRGYDSPEVFENALKEIVEIINGAHLEKMSRETLTEGFEMDILKSSKEKAEEKLKRLNKIHIHKKFELKCIDGKNHFDFLCKNYVDKVDVLLGYRIEVKLRIEEKKINKPFEAFKRNRENLEYSIKGFKFYWNKLDEILLYDDNKHYYWKKAEKEEHFNLIRKKGIDDVISFIKSF